MVRMKRKMNKQTPERDARQDDVNALFIEISGLKSIIKTMEKELMSVKNDLTKVCSERDALRTECERMRVGVRSREINDLEQYTRRNSVRINGIPDEPSEDMRGTEIKVIGLFRDKLGLTISPDNIDICHRMGSYRKDKRRQIIVKFVQRKNALEVLYHRRKLKGQGVSIGEDLTRPNFELLKSLNNVDWVKEAWSKEGRIYAKSVEDVVVQVKVGVTLTATGVFGGPTGRNYSERSTRSTQHSGTSRSVQHGGPTGYRDALTRGSPKSTNDQHTPLINSRQQGSPQGSPNRDDQEPMPISQDDTRDDTQVNDSQPAQRPDGCTNTGELRSEATSTPSGSGGETRSLRQSQLQFTASQSEK